MTLKFHGWVKTLNRPQTGPWAIVFSGLVSCSGNHQPRVWIACLLINVNCYQRSWRHCQQSWASTVGAALVQLSRMNNDFHRFDLLHYLWPNIYCVGVIPERTAVIYPLGNLHWMNVYLNMTSSDGSFAHDLKSNSQEPVQALSGCETKTSSVNNINF